jgi:hypothetical protein
LLVNGPQRWRKVKKKTCLNDTKYFVEEKTPKPNTYHQFQRLKSNSEFQLLKSKPLGSRFGKLF